MARFAQKLLQLFDVVVSTGGHLHDLHGPNQHLRLANILPGLIESSIKSVSVFYKVC